LRFNPVNLLGAALLLLAFLGAWRVRLDLAAGDTRYFGWARIVTPATRRDTPVRYWLAMTLNIALVILFALVGAVALRAGLWRFARL
jgi:hypothetical protein